MLNLFFEWKQRIFAFDDKRSDKVENKKQEFSDGDK